ncbi:MAG: hypothetical protein ABI401_16645 [Candidatus Dormibacter sp.]
MRAAGLDKESEVRTEPRVAEQPREAAGVDGLRLDGSRPMAFDPRMLLGLQAAAGNAAVSGLIAESRQPVAAESAAPPGVMTEAAPPEAAESSAPAGPAEDDLAALDAEAAPGPGQDGDDLASISTRSASSDGDQGGGNGGGGVAIEEAAPPALPSLGEMDPGQALAVASALPAGQFLGALGGVARSVDTAATGEQTRLVRRPPSRPRHAGAPSTIEAPASERSPLAPEPAGRPIARAREGPDVGVRPPAAPPSAPGLPAALLHEPTIASTGKAELSASDTQHLTAAIAQLPVADSGLRVSTGPLPQLPLAGSADPSQIQQQRAHVEASVSAQHADGRRDAAQGFGEAEIYPTAPAETLTASVDAGAPAGDAPADHGEPDDAISLVAQQERGPAIRAAAGAGIAELASQRQAHAARTEQERVKSEQEMAQLERANSAEQGGERSAAQQEVHGLRTQWSQEQAQVVDRAREESAVTTGGALDVTAAARARGEEEAAAHYQEGQSQADAARREGERHAAAERQKAQSQSSGGFLGFVASAARSVFDAARQAVQAGFERARQVVRAAIERAQQFALAAMERARQAIVAAIRLAGETLLVIGGRVLSAFPALRDRFRRAIQERVARAEAAVNRLSNVLRQGVLTALTTLGAQLAMLVGQLRRGMAMVVDRVREVVRGAIDFAASAVASLGTFAVLVRDVAANPGRWLANLAAAAQDGIRNHLWPDLKLAVQSWFTEKVDSVLGLGAAAWSLLKKGGVTTMQVASIAWEGLQSLIPPAIIWVLIEKLVTLIVPAAAAVMLIIQALQAAWGSIGRIIQAFDAFMAFLKGVRLGNAGPLFGKAVAAGAVAVIEFVSQFLLQRIMSGAGKVAAKLRSVAKRIGFRLRAVGGKLAQGAKWAGAGVGRATKASATLANKVNKTIGDKWFTLQNRQLVKSGMAWVDSNGDRCVRHGPMNPGPFNARVAGTFRSSSYTARELGQPKELWRSYSDPRHKLGVYWTDIPPNGPVQTTIDSALHYSFKNAATKTVHISVPAGTTVFEGFAGPQGGGYLGGGPQFLLPTRKASWIN